MTPEMMTQLCTAVEGLGDTIYFGCLFIGVSYIIGTHRPKKED